MMHCLQDSAFQQPLAPDVTWHKFGGKYAVITGYRALSPLYIEHGRWLWLLVARTLALCTRI
jgi:hypothetical protein